MAKLDRNRGMYFVSFTGTAVSESANADKGDSTGITGVTVTAATFGTAVNSVTGTYNFSYDGTNWKLNGATITLTTYGLVVTGTAEDGDEIIVSYVGASSGWEVVGRDNDDLSKELNPDTETSKNVLGEATFKHNGYEPEVGVDPYYADNSSILYDKLLAAAVQEKYGDADIKGYFIEVVFSSVDTAAGTMSGTGYKREAYIVPQSTGGDTSGFGIPFNVYPVGAMTPVTVTYTMSTRAVTVATV